MRPAQAPTARVGIKIPAGSLMLRAGVRRIGDHHRGRARLRQSALLDSVSPTGTHPNVMVVTAALSTSAAAMEAMSGPAWLGVEMHKPERRSDLWHSEKSVEMSSVPPILLQGLYIEMATVRLSGHAPQHQHTGA